MKLKKSFPILMAGLLAFSGIPVSAGTYSDLEIQSVEKFTDQFSAMYKKSLDNYALMTSGQSGAGSDMYIEVTDTVRALLAIASPVDISWLNRVGFSFDTAISGSLYAITGSAYINETDILTFKLYIDTSSFVVYACVPEISPYYLKLDMSADIPAADMEYFALYTADVTSFLPDEAAVKNILNRYCTILFSHMQDGNSGQTTYTVGSEELTSAAFEGRIKGADAYALITDVLTTARTDEDLKALIEAWSVLDQEYGDSYYPEFQSSIDDALTSMEEEKESMTSDDSAYISSSIWTDDEQNIIGRSLSFVENGEKETIMQYSNLNTATDNSFYMNIDADGSTVTFNGTGTYTDGKLSGSYDILLDQESLANIAVTDYDPAAMEQGALNGIFKLTLQPGALDEETYTPLSSFALLAESIMDPETGSSSQVLSVTSADVPLASLHVNAGYTEPIAIPDLSTLDPVLDVINSEDDAMTFISELDWTPILDNCRSAGLPEELITQLDTLISEELFGTGDSYEEDYTDYVYEDDYEEVTDSYSDGGLIDIQISEADSVGVIGGADGPTSIIVEEEPAEELITIE